MKYEEHKSTTITQLKDILMPWFIVCTENTNLAIQGGETPGSGVTLENLDPSNQLQQWQAECQIANGYAGIAFMNPSTGLSITFNGERQQLVMQPYSPVTVDQDAWIIVQAGSGNALRMLWPTNTDWNWNDFNGRFKAGDVVGLWNDGSANSVWSLIYK